MVPGTKYGVPGSSYGCWLCRSSFLTDNPRLTTIFVLMITFPNAKINLGLFITGKRSDGYHNIESGFYPVRWCDVLEVVQGKGGSGDGDGEGLRFTSSGLEIPGDPKSN